MSQPIDIEPGWYSELEDYFLTAEFKKLSNTVRQEYLNKKVFPKPQDIFKAFWLTPFSEVKVLILGQDPYHGPGQAHGLCFSVSDHVAPPPSLVNIYKELESDIGLKKDLTKGNLESWARQGVLLLNAILTVEAHRPASHRGLGWEDFTDRVIKTISDRHQNIVFMLWGNFARSKKSLIDDAKHLIIESAHPSPLSAYSGFLGSKPFSRTNYYLLKHFRQPIDW